MPENEKKQLTPQEIAEQRKVAKEKAIQEVKAPDLSGATDANTSSALAAGVEQVGQSAGQQAISQAYYSPIKGLSDTISGLEQKRKDAIAQDETAQRRSRNMQMIAGISDGLASLANLIGVGQGGTNIDMGQGALTPLQQRLKEDRKERKADIKSIDDRLEQFRRQLDQMRLQKGLAVAEQGERDRAAERARQDKIEERAFQEKLLGIRLEAEKEQKEKALAETIRHNQATEAATKQNIHNDYNLGLQRLNQAAEQAGLKGNYPVVIGDNEMIDIPKEQINDTNVGRIFNQLPKEYQDLAQGKPQYRYEDDGFGGSVKVFDGYEPATLQQKLAAIGAAARNNPDVQDELRKLAGTYKPSSQAAQNTQASEIDNPHLNPLGTMSMDPSFGKSTTSKVNWNQFK